MDKVKQLFKRLTKNVLSGLLTTLTGLLIWAKVMHGYIMLDVELGYRELGLLLVGLVLIGVKDPNFLRQLMNKIIDK